MKFTIERAKLLKTLSHVQSIVEKRNTIPVLSNVRIEAMEDGISFKATDMDTEITEIVDAKTAETGATTAPAHMLYDIVRKLSDGSDVELTFPDEKGQLTIASGRSKFSLSTIGVEDFPVISGDKLPVNFAMGKDELKDVIDRTQFAVSTEETRYYLNGLYIHAKNEGEAKVLRVVATDGHRLACVESPLPERRREHGRRYRSAQNGRRNPQAAGRYVNRQHYHRPFGKQNPLYDGRRYADLETD